VTLAIPYISAEDAAFSPHAFDVVPGEILLKMRTQDAANALLQSPSSAIGSYPMLQAAGATSASPVFQKTEDPVLRRYVKMFVPAIDAKATAALSLRLSADPNIESAEPNVIMSASQFNDPYYGSSGAWGQSFEDLWGLTNAKRRQTWPVSQGQGVTVAVIDTGIDAQHPDIAANIWTNAGETNCADSVDNDNNGFVDDCHGWDFVNNDNDPADDHGHGTHVSGTIAAVGNNGIGIVGMAPQSKIMPLKVLNNQATGFIDVIAAAVVYGADNGAKVANMSLGACCGFSQILFDAISYAHDVKDQVVVVAAGNNNADVYIQDNGFVPANIRKVITVAASDHLDQKASFSNFGQKIDVIAPGGGDADPSNIFAPDASILSLKAANNTFYSGFFVGTNYARLAGTSMASPHVAGLAAAIRSWRPQFSNEVVRQSIRDNADDVLAPGYDWQSGYGRINSSGSLSIYKQYPVAALITSPTLDWVSGKNLPIRGTANGQWFSSWDLDYGAGDFPTTWLPLTQSSTPVNDGLLYTWNAPSNLPVGRYTIRLTAHNPWGGTFEDRISLTIDPSLRSGWPKRGPFPWSFTDVDAATFTGLTFVDVDGDGKEDLPVRLGDVVHIYKSDGTDVAGWPKVIPGTYVDAVPTSYPTVKDLDGDGSVEVVVATEGSATNPQQVFAWHADGTTVAGWPKTVPAFTRETPFVGIDDIDNNGVQDVVLTTTYANPSDRTTVWVWDKDGNVLSGWPVQLPVLSAAKSTLIVDLDQNGTKELVLNASTPHPNKVYVLNYQGATLPGWPQTIAGDGSFHAMNMAAGDVTGDNIPEIFVGTSYDFGGGVPKYVLYAFNVSGQQLPGWPKTITGIHGNQGMGGPVLGDITNDGVADVVVPGDDYINGVLQQVIYAWKGDGSAISGWPVVNPGTSTILPAIIADADGNGSNDVILPGVNKNIVAYTGNGTAIGGDFPKYSAYRFIAISNRFYKSLALGDMDNDGLAELAAIDDSNYLYLWDLSFAPKAKCGWRMYMHNPAQTGLFSNSNCVGKVGPPIELPPPTEG
jgi:subtilisin family serine protease